MRIAWKFYYYKKKIKNKKKIYGRLQLWYVWILHVLSWRLNDYELDYEKRLHNFC